MLLLSSTELSRWSTLTRRIPSVETLWATNSFLWQPRCCWPTQNQCRHVGLNLLNTTFGSPSIVTESSMLVDATHCRARQRLKVLQMQFAVVILLLIPM